MLSSPRNSVDSIGRSAPYLRQWLGRDDLSPNLTLSAAPALPFPEQDDSLRLIVWPHTAAQMADVPAVLAETQRILAPDGVLFVSDILVPGSRLRGKKAHREREAGRYINIWTRLGHPSHQRYFDSDSWQAMLGSAGLQIQHQASETRALTLHEWLGDAPRTLPEQQRLAAMLVQAPERVNAFLTPVSSAARISFQLTDIFILATVAS